MIFIITLLINNHHLSSDLFSFFIIKYSKVCEFFLSNFSELFGSTHVFLL